VVLGTFNTNMSRTSRTPRAETALPDGYDGTFIDKIMHAIFNGSFESKNDKDKAMKAVFEVVLGEGKIGEGNGSETFLPLGTEIVARTGMVRDYLQHGLDVFLDTTNGVAIDT
jgi:hypothetical protein